LLESESRYRRLFETAQDAILILNADTGKIADVNPYLVNMLGYSRREFMGKRLWEIMPSTSVAASRAAFQELQTKGYIRHENLPLEAKDGTHISVEFVSNMYRVNGKKVIQCNIRDITERKRLEAVLQRQQEEVRTIMDSVPAWVFYKDTENRFIRVNRAFAEIMEMPKDKLEGKSLFDLYPKEQAEAYWRDDKKVIVSGKPKRNILEFVLIKNETRWVQTDKIPHRDTQGNIVGIIGFTVDITERKIAEDTLRKHSEEITDLYHHAPCGYHSLGPDGTFLRINDTETRWLGYAQDEIIGKKKWSDLLTPDSLNVFQKNFPVFKKQGWIHNLEFEVIRKDGSTFWVLLNATAIKNAEGDFIMSRSTIIDITQRKQVEKALHEAERKYHGLYESIKDGILMTDIKGHILECNMAYEKMLGYSARELMKLTYKQITPEKWHVMEEDIVRKRILTTSYSDEYEKEYIRKDGTIFPVAIRVWLIRDKQENPVGMWAIVRDITERKRIEEDLRALSLTDELTGFANRRGFHAVAIQQLKIASRFGKTVKLIYADVDRMKWINDIFGHNQGDTALKETANILKENFREADLIARIGGDEFVVLAMDNTEQTDEIMISRLRERIQARNEKMDLAYDLSLSIGIAHYVPERPCSLDELMDQADKMMYEDKKARKNQ